MSVLPRRLHLICVFGLASALLVTSAARGQSVGPAGFLESLKGNTVRVEDAGSSGFGFIVGLGRQEVFIATAWHILESSGVTEPEVCFFNHEPCLPGSVAYVADAVGDLPALDLAVLRVPYPEKLNWRVDVVDLESTVGSRVWSIGRAREWYVPAEPGQIVTAEPSRRIVVYKDLAVAEGVSGSPVISSNGIVAMHLQSIGTGETSEGLALDAIRERVNQNLSGRWVLAPLASCAEGERHKEVIEGQTIVVHFDWERFASGVEAMSRLRCLGASALPRPVWDAEAWSNEGIVYGSAHLRLARTVQGALAPSLGRLELQLGESEGDVDLWIR